MKKPEKPKQPTISDLEQQKRNAYKIGQLDKANKVQKKLDYFYWGIK